MNVFRFWNLQEPRNVYVFCRRKVWYFWFLRIIKMRARGVISCIN